MGSIEIYFSNHFNQLDLDSGSDMNFAYFLYKVQSIVLNDIFINNFGKTLVHDLVT